LIHKYTLVLGLSALFKFIHSQGVQDDGQVDEDVLNDSDIELLDEGVNTRKDAKRNQIAVDMWKDYCHYIGRDI
jgi:hypothetical protein